MVDPFVLTLIRHARTAGNVERRYVGWTDDPIVETSLSAIDTNVDIVYGSDLKRCRQTAASYFPQAKFIGLTQLREANFGDFEMKTYEQLKNQPAYRNWLDDAQRFSPPNGESIIHFTKRVLEGMKEIPPSKQCHIVAHGGSIRVILMSFAPQPSEFWDWSIRHEEQYHLFFDSFQQFKEGQRCTSLSVEPIMVKGTM